LALIETLTMSPCIDQTCVVDSVVPDRKLACRDIKAYPGGGGINVARVLHRLGCETVAHYTQGGPTGDRLAALLEQEHVPQRPIPIDGETRVNLIVKESSSGQQFRFGMPGTPVREEEWKTCLEQIVHAGKPHYIVASGNLPPMVPLDFYGRLAQLAKAEQIPCIIDTRGEALKRSVEIGVYLLKPNLRELSTIVGHTIEDEKEQEDFARQLVEQGKCEILVLSLGQAGALLVTREGKQRIRSPSVRVRSKVGAGDSMVAGIVLGLSRGMSPARCVRFGIAAGAAAAMTPGTELCHREDVERLFESIDNEEN